MSLEKGEGPDKQAGVIREDSITRAQLCAKLAASTLLLAAACESERSYNRENVSMSDEATAAQSSTPDAGVVSSGEVTPEGGTVATDTDTSDNGTRTSEDLTSQPITSDATSSSETFSGASSSTNATSDSSSNDASSTTEETREPALVSVVVVLDASTLTNMDERATLTVLCQYEEAEAVTCTNRASIDIENSAVVRLDDDGGFAPVTNGTTAIVASVDGVISEPATLVVDLGPVCTLLHLDGPATSAAGTSVKWEATCDFDDGTSDVNVSELVTWESDTESVAPISETGSISASTVGSTTITASLANPDRSTASSSRSFTVTNGELVTITIAPLDGVSLPEGTTGGFTAECEYTDVTSDCTDFVTWVSGSPLVATVGDGGVATANGPGNTQLWASLSGISSNELAVTVTEPVLTSIVLTPNGTVTIEVNAERQISATCFMSNSTSSDCTSEATWSTSQPTVATANEGGRIGGLTDGTTLITAAKDGVISSPLTASIVPPNGCENAIDFPDPVMLQDVRDATGKAAGSIYYEDVKSITWFEHSQSNGFLEFLDGIECFTSLQNLTVQRAWLADLSPISGLVYLESLDVAFTSVIELPDLSLLTNLSNVNLVNTPITDVFPLVQAEHFAEGDSVTLVGAALNCTDDWILEQLAELEARGVTVAHSCE